jgi:hypothetical protein
MDNTTSRYNQDQSQIAMSLGSNKVTPLDTLSFSSTTDFDTLNGPLRPVTRRRRLHVGAPYTMRGGAASAYDSEVLINSAIQQPIPNDNDRSIVHP